MADTLVSIKAVDNPHGLAYATHVNGEDAYREIDNVLDEYKQLIRDMDAQTVCLNLTIRGERHDVGYEQLTMSRDLSGDPIPTSIGPFKVVANGMCIAPDEPMGAVELYDALFNASMNSFYTDDQFQEQGIYNESTGLSIKIHCKK